jgi:hypothetical protein
MVSLEILTLSEAPSLLGALMVGLSRRAEQLPDDVLETFGGFLLN